MLDEAVARDVEKALSVRSKVPSNNTVTPTDATAFFLAVDSAIRTYFDSAKAA